jgi:peptidoglycan/LPS O-acetylase OafA/YrhL
LHVVWLKTAGPRLDFLVVGLAILGAVAVSLALYRGIERPLSTWLQGRMKPNVPPPVADRMALALRSARPILSGKGQRLGTQA